MILLVLYSTVKTQVLIPNLSELYNNLLLIVEDNIFDYCRQVLPKCNIDKICKKFQRIISSKTCLRLLVVVTYKCEVRTNIKFIIQSTFYIDTQHIEIYIHG